MGFEVERLELDAAEVADQIIADERGWAARLAADDRGQRLTLRIVRPLVDHAGEDPVAIGHDFAETNDQRELQPIELGIAAIPFIDPKHQRRGAVIVGHRGLRVRVNARTQVVAVAALHVFAAHRPFLLCHVSCPSTGVASRNSGDPSHRRSLPLAANRGPVPISEMGPSLRRDDETDQWACCFFSKMRWWRLRTIIPVSLSSWMN